MVHFKFDEIADGRVSVIRTNGNLTKEMIVHSTLEEIFEGYNKWSNGELIQKAFPDLNDDEREFFISGITPGEWKRLFGDEIEDYM